MSLRLFLRTVCSVMIFLVLSGCGVVYSYKFTEDNIANIEKPLSFTMTKSDLEETLGKPKVIRDNGRILVLEYRLYPRYHWVKELVACPFTAWLGGCLFYPAIGVGDPNYPKPYYVILSDGRLCLWGPFEFVNTSKTCQAPPPKSPLAGRDGT